MAGQYIMTERGEWREELKWYYMAAATAVVGAIVAVFLWRAIHVWRHT